MFNVLLKCKENLGKNGTSGMRGRNGTSGSREKMLLILHTTSWYNSPKCIPTLKKNTCFLRWTTLLTHHLCLPLLTMLIYHLMNLTWIRTQLSDFPSDIGGPRILFRPLVGSWLLSCSSSGRTICENELCLCRLSVVTKVTKQSHLHWFWNQCDISPRQIANQWALSTQGEYLLSIIYLDVEDWNFLLHFKFI